jgi:hypothetical protein
VKRFSSVATFGKPDPMNCHLFVVIVRFATYREPVCVPISSASSQLIIFTLYNLILIKYYWPMSYNCLFLPFHFFDYLTYGCETLFNTCVTTASMESCMM